MNLRPILFVGHAYHSTTKSSQFFIDLLKEGYELEILNIDPSDNSACKAIEDLNLNHYSAVVLWQIDYLAAYFLDRGCPTIVCPMYDGSGSLDPLHWKSIQNSLIFSFSLELHWKISQTSNNSIYVRYFPPNPLQDKSFDTNNVPSSGLNVFYWERLPNSLIDFHNVSRLIEDLPVKTFHIHQVPDPGHTSTLIPERNDKYDINVSKWFKKKSDLYDLIASSDLFIAPRYSEGIGMSFLEAMHLNCCVVAHDMSTHNEYINNGANGILVNFHDESMKINLATEDIRMMALRAQQDSTNWRNLWTSHYKYVVRESINEYIDGFNSQVSPLNVQRFSRIDSLAHAHVDWDKYWNSLQLRSRFLTHQPKVISMLCEVHKLELDGNYHEAIAVLDKLYLQNPLDVYLNFKNLLSERIKSKMFR